MSSKMQFQVFYDEYNVMYGPNIEAVKDAVRLWAISLKREFRVVKSSSKEYEVKCVNTGCPWRVHAFKGRWKSN